MGSHYSFRSAFYFDKILFIFLYITISGCKEIKTESENSSIKGSKPNIVFILADDMGWNQVNYHNVTNYYSTPNIDDLSASGISFTNAYSAAPVCTPARASIMTGKYPARLHLTDYLPGNQYPYAKLLTAEQRQDGLPLEEVTIAEMLKSVGYVTGHFGKWHLNKDKNYAPNRLGDPGSQGFDDVLATVKPKPDSKSDDAHHVKEITKRTIEFIEKNKDKPFFAYVSHHVVHRPLMEDKDLINLYKTKPNNEDLVNNPIMGAMIERMDRSIGQILDKLEELDLTNNTIIVFASDNGGFKYLQDQAPLRGGKAMLFEGGIRVPLIIKWPNVVKQNRVIDYPVITNDFFPTFAEILGLEIENQEVKDDAVSLLPLLKGENNITREAIFWYYPHYHRQGFKPSAAIRMGDYKLIEWYERTLLGLDYGYELYNIKDDIGENNNLADQMPELVNQMRNRLNRWVDDVGAKKMIINSNFDPEKQYLPELNWIDGDFEYIDMHFPNRQE